MLYCVLKRGFGSGGFIIVILLFIVGGTYYYNEKYGPIFKAAGCDKMITLYSQRDGVSLPQTINFRGSNFRIDSHIEAEDKWASFTVNGDSGASVANPLAVAGSGLPFPHTTSIRGLSITLKQIGITSDGREFVQVCLS